MSIPNEYLQVLRECSRDDTAFQRLVHFLAPLLKTETDQVELEANQALLAAIVQGSGEAIASRDMNDIITSWNPRAEIVFGYRAEEVIGQHASLLIPPDHQVEMEINRSQLLRGEYIAPYETVRLRKDGSLVDILLTVSPIKDKNGNLLGIASINQDITELKHAQNAVRESEAHYKAIITMMDEGIMLRDSTGYIQTLNPAAERLLGYTLEQMRGETPGSSLWRAVHEDFSPYTWDMFPSRVALSTGQPVVGVVIGVYKPDGTFGWILVNARPMFKSGETKPYAVVTTFTDINPLKEMENALQKSEARLRSIVETIDDAVWSIELPGHTMSYMSPSIEKITGHSAEEFYKNNDLRYEMIHPDDLLMVRKNNKLNPKDTLSYSFEHRIVQPDQTVRWIHNRGWLIRDQLNQPMRIEGIISDITERKQLIQQTLELEIEHKRIELLGDFITNTSHELRNPLSTISTGLYLLTRMDDRKQREQKAEAMKLEIHYLNRMIEQLHQMAKLDAMKQIDASPLHLNVLVRAITNHYGPPTDELELNVQLAPNLRQINGDPDYLTLAISHLIGNAIHFSSAPRQVLICSRAETDKLLLQVTDHGMGIAPEHLPHIFEHFYKVDMARTRSSSGVGMGLALVKRIMQLHHGEVTVESKIGQGSTFTLHFPFA